MAYECPDYEWNQFGQYDRHHCCQLTNSRRRRSTSRCSQETPWQSPPSPFYYYRSGYFDNEKDVYEQPLRYEELDQETMPDDYLLADYYMDAAPNSPWPRSPRQFRQRPRLVVRQAYRYEDEDDNYPYNDDDMPTREDLYNHKGNGVGRYFDPMVSSPLLHPSARETHTCRHKQSRRSTRNFDRTPLRNHQIRHSPNLDYANWSDDDYEDDSICEPNNYHRTRQHRNNTPRRRHSLQHYQRRSSIPISSPIMGSPSDASPVRQHQQSVLQPMLQTDTQNSLPFYGQAPLHGPSMIPMPQPMIHPSSMLPYSHPQLGYGISTMPGMVLPPGSAAAPGSSIPFGPMMMMVPPSLTDTQNSHGISQQTHTQNGVSAEVAAIPSDEIPRESPKVDNTSPTVTSPVSSSASAPTTTEQRGENALIPLVRSLSLGDARSLGTKPRRRSLFESLFNLDGSNLSRNNSISSNSNSASSSTTSSSSSMIPIQELATHTLTRKQSLSLEKKVKALSQRSYIWCYQLKKPPAQQQQGVECWVAMTLKNQKKLDPYICYYHPSAMVKGARTDNLATLVTLDKEPKLSGSFTVMPQAKIGRVYPSMFSSANYIELLIDCLPADSQFVVRSG